MKAYFDTSALIKLYFKEADSVQADALTVSFPSSPIILTHLQKSELKNGLRLKLNRKEITEDQYKATLQMIQNNLNSGEFEPLYVDWEAAWNQVDLLFDKYGLATHCRTLDILHVAVALTLGCKVFYTFDYRQRALAEKVHLKTSL